MRSTWCLCVLALAACTVGPDFRAPDPPADATYTRGPAPAQGFVQVEEIGGAWWKALGSADLDRLVQQALEASPTLAQARARLAQAREDYAAQAGTRYPAVDLTADAVRQRINPAAFAGGSLFGNRALPPFTLYEVKADVSYSLDLFGANRRALEALAAGIDYRQYELDAARLTLAGNVVTTAIRRASLATQVQLTTRLLETRSRELDIATQRWQAGGIAEADVISLRTQVEQARASLPPLEAQLAQADHQLAVYLGATPAQGTPRTPDLAELALPAQLPLTLPASLARNRPDIRASEALLHQASANVGVATAHLYPQIQLTASLGADGTQLRHLVDIWSIGAGLTQPIFHGGELRARERSAEQAYEAAAAAYREAVLKGLQQVADALRTLENDSAELDARARAQRDAAAAADVARRRYEAGGISLVALLDAQRTELQASIDLSRVRAQRLADGAALYTALGAKP